MGRPFSCNAPRSEGQPCLIGAVYFGTNGRISAVRGRARRGRCGACRPSGGTLPSVPGRGASESQAIEIALSQATDWQELGREISDIKNEEAGMNDRSKQLWLPGLVTLTASMVWLMMLQRVNWNLGSSWFHGSPPLMAYLMWLITQPVFGAAGAYLSRRNGGTLIAGLAAGIFPSIALLGLLIFITFTGVFVERNPFVWKHPAFFALVVFPG